MATPAPYVQTCAAADLNLQTGVCTNPVWVQQSPGLVLPPLSAADGAQIGIAILAVWAVGFGIKCARRVISQS